MRRTLTIGLLIGVLLLVVACGQAGGEGPIEATPTPLPTPVVAQKPEYVVQDGTVVNSLEFTARVSPVTEQQLFFRKDGVVNEVFVQRGDVVQPGDVIAALDLAELQSQLATAQLSLDEQETTLVQETQKNLDSIVEAELEVENAQIALELAEQKLADAADTNEEELADQRVNVASARVKVQRAQLAITDAGTSNTREIADQQASVESAQLKVWSAQEALADADGTLADDLAAAQRELRDAQLALQSAELDLSQANQTNQFDRRNAALQLEAAQIALRQAQAGNPSANVTSTEIELKNANDRVYDAEREYAEVLDREWASEDEIKFYRDDLDAAREQQRIARANYDEALRSAAADPEDVRARQIDVEQRQIDVEKANQGVDAGLALAVEQQRLNVQRKQADLVKLEAGIDPQLSRDLQQARLDLQTAQRALQNLQSGIDGGLNLDLQQARLDLQLQINALEKLEKGIDPTLELEVEQQRISLQLKELTLEKLQRGVDPLLALNVEKAELEVADIERQIGDAQLLAPFEGEVLRLDVKAGDSTSAFDVVSVLAEPGALEVSAELTAEQLDDLSVNQPAIIRMRNRPEEDLAAYVRLIPASYSGSTTAGDTDRAVRIAFGDEGTPIENTDGGGQIITLAPPELEIGELATVIVVLEEKQGVLWVPPEAIRSFQGRDFVVVRDADGNQRRVDIRIGIESEDRVEIVAGLESGWVIVGE